MVKRVRIESDALQVCMAHALSTEKEEVMGLLIGEISDDGFSHIHTVIMLRRLDKRKDRVEISPEQLSNASTQAEKLGLKTRLKKPMRIIGWYHSHPHITVWPSHVDVSTQQVYQMMDRDFVGLILSCYNDDPNNLGQMQVTCFQSVEVASRIERVEIPVEIVPCSSLSDACLEALYSLPEILLQIDYESGPFLSNAFMEHQNSEEKDAYTVSLSHAEQDLITAVQNGAVFTKALMRIIEIICAPLLENMENQVDENNERVKKLKIKRQKLLEQIQNISNSS